MPQRILLICSLAVTLLGGALAFTATAAHATGPEVGVADDRTLLAGGKRADKAVREWQRNGVDVVRIFALWSRFAPTPHARRAPKHFDARDPNSGYNWWALDQAVARVRAAGLKVMLTVSGPAPRWATGKHKRNGTYKPSASAYGNYARAVARRYGPAVDRYVLWNEPNSGAFLGPQSEGKGRRQALVAAHVYRRLVRAAYRAIHQADRGAQVLIGALAPKAADRKNKTTSPLAFMRAFGCVDSRMHRLRKGWCKRYKAPTGDGFAVHPYGARTAPDLAPRGVEDVNLATLDRIEATLDRLRRMHRVKGPRRMGIFVDEYGYQTNPPDRRSGVRPRVQDQWLQRGAYLAWRNHRIKLLTQYLWYDEPKAHGSYANWQSGVRYARGRAKPSLRHFDTPFAVDSRRSRLWGQMRPGGRQRVLVQQRPRGRHAWRTIKRVWTDRRGYWTLKRRLAAGTSYRFRAGSATSSALRR